MKDWKTVKHTLKKESGIQVHFSDACNTVTIGANSNRSKKWHKYFSINHPNMQEISSPKATVWNMCTSYQAKT